MTPRSVTDAGEGRCARAHIRRDGTRFDGGALMFACAGDAAGPPDSRDRKEPHFKEKVLLTEED